MSKSTGLSWTMTDKITLLSPPLGAHSLPVDCTYCRSQVEAGRKTCQTCGAPAD